MNWPHCAMTTDNGHSHCTQAATYYVGMDCPSDAEHTWVFPMCDMHAMQSNMGNATCTECGRHLDVSLMHV